MKIQVHNELKSVDCIADENDFIEVEVVNSPSGLVLYIHVNDVTIIRVGRVRQEINITRRDSYGKKASSES